MRWAVCIVVCLALAGCSKAPADAPLAQAEPGATVGDLRCSIVDGAIAPIVGATVHIVALDRQTTSGSNGQCLLKDVPVGTHILDVTAPGFRPTQTEARVTGDDAVVRVQLARDLTDLQYVNEFYWEGYIECGVNYFAVCGALHDTVGLTDDTYTTWFDTETNITHLQTELVWRSTQELGDSFDMQHRYGTPEDHEAGLYTGTLGRAKGPSPLVLRTDVRQYNTAEVGERFEFVVAIFSGPTDTAQYVGLTLGQSFELFVHEFHGFEPPPGWQFTVHGTVAPG